MIKNYFVVFISFLKMVSKQHFSKGGYMRINSIGFYNTRQSAKSSFVQKDIQVPEFKLHTNPFLHVAVADTVSFTSVRPPFFLKAIANLPCPCCGVKMVRSQDLARKLTESTLGGSSAKAVNALSEFEENMQPTEKACFQLIKERAKKTPNVSLAEVLASAKNEYLDELKKDEFRVLDKLDETAKQLSKSSAKKVKDITLAARKIIATQGPTESFKRKTMLDTIYGLKRQIPEKGAVDNLVKIAQELPTSSDNVNAFMVKYSKRDSVEIGQRLLSPSLGTFEHIKPKSKGGTFKDSNGLLECAGCNNPRGNLAFDKFALESPGMLHNIPEGTDLGGKSTEEWVAAHPEHKGNLQKHMDIVIKMINDGRIKGYDKYPEEVAETLNKESKGIIKLDISALKPKAKGEGSVDVAPLVDKYNREKPSVAPKAIKKDDIGPTTNPFEKKDDPNNKVRRFDSPKHKNKQKTEETNNEVRRFAPPIIKKKKA